MMNQEEMKRPPPRAGRTDSGVPPPPMLDLLDHPIPHVYQPPDESGGVPSTPYGPLSVPTDPRDVKSYDEWALPMEAIPGPIQAQHQVHNTEAHAGSTWASDHTTLSQGPGGRRPLHSLR